MRTFISYALSFTVISCDLPQSKYHCLPLVCWCQTKYSKNLIANSPSLFTRILFGIFSLPGFLDPYSSQLFSYFSDSITAFSFSPYPNIRFPLKVLSRMFFLFYAFYNDFENSPLHIIDIQQKCIKYKIENEGCEEHMKC